MTAVVASNSHSSQTTDKLQSDKQTTEAVTCSRFSTRRRSPPASCRMACLPDSEAFTLPISDTATQRHSDTATHRHRRRGREVVVKS